MTSERALAYGRVKKTIEDVGSAKLQPIEIERLREAADTLLFIEEPADARDALRDVEALCLHLIESGRWSDERAAQLRDDVAACGPVSPV